MSKPKKNPLDKIVNEALENPVQSEAAEEVGKNLLQALIAELTLIPHPTMNKQNVWSTRKEKDQRETIERFKSRIRTEVVRFFRTVMSNGNPAALAELEKVVFTDKGIQGTLAIDRNSRERHALADFAGKAVAVIMPDDIDEYLSTMDEVLADADQPELPLNSGKSDESKPAAASDDNSGARNEPTAAAAQRDPAPEPNGDDDPQPTDEDIELYEALNNIGIVVLLDIVMAWNSEYCESAWQWVQKFEKGSFDADEVPTPPEFLAEYADSSKPGPADAEPVADEKPLSAMLKAELVDEAMRYAASIGEGDITDVQFGRKTKAGLIEYIEYAHGELSKKAAELSEDTRQVPTAGPAELDPQLLIDELKTVLGLEIPLESAQLWPENDRTEIRAYLSSIMSGKLPERVPDIIGPYLSEND